MTRTAIFGAVALLSPATGSAAGLLQPTGKWVVHYDEAQCVATRPYGSEEKPLYLIIKPSPTSGVIQLVLMKNGSDEPGVQTEAMIAFDGRPPAKVKVLEFGVQKKSMKMANLPEEFAAGIAGTKTIKWDKKGSTTWLETGPMAEMMKVLANCRDDLRDYWNITDAKQQTLRAPAKPITPLPRLFTSGDYPGQAVMSRESGMTSIVLLIDEKGAVGDCMLDGTSGIATLDAMTCIVFRKRGKFEPAVGTDGKPKRGAITQRVRWEMPR